MRFLIGLFCFASEFSAREFFFAILLEIFSVKYRLCIVIVDCFFISFTCFYFFYGYTKSMDWYDRILVIYIEINAYRIIFTQIFAWSCWITDSIWRVFYVSTSFDRLMILRTIAYIFNSNSMQSLVLKEKTCKKLLNVFIGYFYLQTQHKNDVTKHWTIWNEISAKKEKNNQTFLLLLVNFFVCDFVFALQKARKTVENRERINA